MKHRQEALQRLRAWPRDKWCTQDIETRDGSRCALGIMAGDVVPLRLESDYYSIFNYSGIEEYYDIEADSIYSLNDSKGLDAVIAYVESLPDDDAEVSE